MSRIYDRDPYAILGIPSTASASQIKDAYHRLARQYHPDVNRDPRAGERMKDINWAHDILSDPEQRSLYDYWRSSSVGPEYNYYPGTGSQHSTGGSSRTPSSSPGSRTRKPPPSNPQGERTYPNVRVTARSSPVGCASWGIVWVIVILVTNLVRAIGPSLSQSSYNYSPENKATQAALMEMYGSTLDAFYAAKTSSAARIMDTPVPTSRMFVTPSPVPKAREEAEPVQEGWRAKIVPGSWEWEHIHQYFPELTTPNGLTEEVTLVSYDQLRGYRIQTRSSGEYWILVDRINHSLMPVHYSPTETAQPSP
jgi:curved DNA-binding protein CbpA